MEKLFWAFICCVVPTAVSHEVRTVWKLWKPLLAQPLLCLHHYLSLSFSCQGAVHNETLPKFISEKKIHIYIGTVAKILIKTTLELNKER